MQVAPWQLEIEVRCQASVTAAVARAAPWHRCAARASARGPLPAGQMPRVDFLLLDSRDSSVGRESRGSRRRPSAPSPSCRLRGSENTVIPDVLPRQHGTQLTFGITNRALHSTSESEGFWIHRAIYPLEAAHKYRSRSSLSTLVARVTRERSMDGWGILTSREIDCSRCSTTFSHTG